MKVFKIMIQGAMVTFTIAAWLFLILMICLATG